MSPAASQNRQDPFRPISGQVARFAMVGAGATGTHYLVAVCAVMAIDVYRANLPGYLAAVAISYFWP